MKARAEGAVASRGLVGPRDQAGPGRDPRHRVRGAAAPARARPPRHRPSGTGPPWARSAELAAAGYVAAEDAAVLADAYRFLRTVEHRLQLVEEEQTHAVPADAARPAPAGPGPRLRGRRPAHGHGPLRRRPAALPDATCAPSTSGSSSAPARGLRRRRRTARPPGADRGARSAAPSPACRPRPWPGVWPPSASPTPRARGPRSRSSPAASPAARGSWRSCCPCCSTGCRSPPIPTSGSRAAQPGRAPPPPGPAGHHLPGIARGGPAPVPAARIEPDPGRGHRAQPRAHRRHRRRRGARPRPARRPGGRGRRAPAPQRRRDGRREQLVRMRQDQHVRIAARDLLDIDDVVQPRGGPHRAAEGAPRGRPRRRRPAGTLRVVGMGRLGGAEMSYASDLDVLLVYDDADDADGEAVAEALLRFIHGPSPAQRVATIDLGLRPEGGQGRLARDLAATRLLRALGRDLGAPGPARGPGWWPATAPSGARFMALVDDFVWDNPSTDDDVADIRRMKARIERERIPAREDPQFHLKLGRGSLSDIEWTVQLLQLRHQVPGPSTTGRARRALHAARRARRLPTLRRCATPTGSASDTRNRWHLVGRPARGRVAGGRPAHRRRPAVAPGPEPRHHPGGAARRLPPGHPAGPAGGRTPLLRDRRR